MTIRGWRARGTAVAVLVLVGWLVLLGFGGGSQPGSRAEAQSPPADASSRTGAADGDANADADAGSEDGGVDTGGRPGVPRVDVKESFLRWMIRASGWIGVLIAAMSFYLFALVVWMALRYRTPVAVPRALIREVQELLEHRKFSEAYHRLAADGSMLARVLAAGVRKLPSGLPAAQRAMELANEDATMEMEHRTTYLATVGTLGPMIGLVGTVYGMIMAFRVIATEGSSPQASQLAAGISTALFATLEGIGISIPAIYFYSLFRNRIARLSLEAAIAAEPLLEQFAPGVRPEEPAAPVAVPMPGGGVGGAAAHPHPYAASAALAASVPGPGAGAGAGSAGGPRTALPPARTD